MDRAAIDQLIQSRYGRGLPDLWHTVHERGCFDPFAEAHLQVSDLRWLSAEEIQGWRFPADQVPGLLPFAVTGNDDCWCLYQGMAHNDEWPVVFCPHEDEVAFAHSPDFTGFLFRVVVEEYACTCLTEHHAPGTSLAILGGYGERIADCLPAPWAAQLSDIAQRPLLELEHGYFGTIAADEAEDVIAQAFAAWPHFDREFEQFTGN